MSFTMSGGNRIKSYSVSEENKENSFSLSEGNRKKSYSVSEENKENSFPLSEGNRKKSYSMCEELRKNSFSMPSPCSSNFLLPLSSACHEKDLWKEPDKSDIQKTLFGKEARKDSFMGPTDINEGPGRKMEEEEEEESVGLLDRLMLVSSLFSIEMCMCFQQLYQVLFLQFLGVPLALVSVDGIVSGFAGMFILPLVGAWADGGHNTKRRKMITMAGSLSVFVSGLVLLIVASCLKIQKLESIVDTLSQRSSNDSIFVAEDNSYASSVVFDGNHTIESNSTSEVDQRDDGMSERSVDVKSSTVGLVVISIVGFTFLDMGFDLTIALSRASILDAVPKFQHKQVLVLATIVQSVAGFSCAGIGCFDLPEILGDIFSTDGTAATLIFFCCLLMTISFISFTLMVLANYRLSWGKTNASICSLFSEGTAESPRTFSEEILIQAAFEQLEERASLSVNGTVSRLSQLQDNQVFASSHILTNTADIYKQPLLLNSIQPNYLTMSKDKLPEGFSEVDPLQKRNLTTNLEITNSENDTDSEKYSSWAPSCSGAKNRSDSFLSCSSTCTAKDEEQETLEIETATTVLEALPYSTAITSISVEALNVFKEDEMIGHEDTLKLANSGKWEERYMKMKKKMAILCASSFFAIGTSLSFAIYSFNALNIGIMHGDPKGLPGSKGLENYEKGLKFGSFGNMVFYTTFLVISSANGRLIQVIGEKGQYIMNHVVLIAGLVALVTSESQNVFMMFMVCCGLFRPCVLTLPYVMAHQFAQEGMPSEEENSSSKQSYMGRVMTLIGLLVPAHYCLLSTIMGPLMEATGNPWVPLFYSLGSCSVSLGVFSLLFFF